MRKRQAVLLPRAFHADFTLFAFAAFTLFTFTFFSASFALGFALGFALWWGLCFLVVLRFFFGFLRLGFRVLRFLGFAFFFWVWGFLCGFFLGDVGEDLLECEADV